LGAAGWSPDLCCGSVVCRASCLGLNKTILKNNKKQNKTKQNKTKQNKTKQNKTKQNKTKQNKTKQHVGSVKRNVSYCHQLLVKFLCPNNFWHKLSVCHSLHDEYAQIFYA
jgi:hypothetical protein